MSRNRLLWISVVALTVLGAGCRYDMQDQPRLKPFKQSDFFADKRGSRDIPAGTVARGQLKADKSLYTGMVDNPDPKAVATTIDGPNGTKIVTSFPNVVSEFPIPVTQELVDRGQERYTAFCSACHGALGDGNGMIARRGFTRPPTYHDDRLRNAPVGHFFNVITIGQGNMASYASQIPVIDRWAIVAYIRALQISHDPTATAAPATAPAAAPAAPAKGGKK